MDKLIELMWIIIASHHSLLESAEVVVQVADTYTDTFISRNIHASNK